METNGLAAKLIDGKSIANEIQNEVKAEVEEWVKSGKRKPKLIAILVGNDPASNTYVGNKMKSAISVGIDSETLRYDETISSEKLLGKIKELNEDPSVDGILVQLPLPSHINESEACQSITPNKDVDGFHKENMGKLAIGVKGLVPATPAGVRELLVRSKIDCFGKNAVVIGRSNNVGLPIALLLHADGRNETEALDMTTTICHRFTPPEELERYVKLADVIVTATGIPGLIKKDMVKPGACIIDVGITRITKPDGKTKLVGDVDFDEVKHVAGRITPVPGGVGPMTVAMLMKNTMLAARLNDKEKNCH